MGKFLILIVALVSASAFANDCHLKNPIPLSANGLKYGMYLTGVVLDHAPEFPGQGAYDATRDTLDLTVFPIHIVGAESDDLGYFGTSLSVHMSHQEMNAILGNSTIYFNVDRDAFTGETRQSADETVHSFAYRRTFSRVDGCAFCRAGDGLEQTVIKVKDNAITSIQFTVPAITNYIDQKGELYPGFTGGHLTYCVQEAH